MTACDTLSLALSKDGTVSFHCGFERDLDLTIAISVDGVAHSNQFNPSKGMVFDVRASCSHPCNFVLWEEAEVCLKSSISVSSVTTWDKSMLEDAVELVPVSDVVKVVNFLAWSQLVPQLNANYRTAMTCVGANVRVEKVLCWL